MATNDASYIKPSRLFPDFITPTPISNSQNTLVRSPTGKRKRKGSVSCLRCDKTIILETDVYYTCSVNVLAVCFQCTGISIAMHKSFQDLGENNFMWACRDCKQNVTANKIFHQSLKRLLHWIVQIEKTI